MGGGSSIGRPSFTRSSSSNNGTIDQYSNDDQEKKKVFISYSMRNKAQVGLLRYQAENEDFDVEFTDTSLKRAVKGRSWKPVVGHKIQNSDVVICMVGDDTHSRTAVSWEIEYAYKHDITVIPVNIHKDHSTKMPTEITYNNGKAISWNMEDIQYHIDRAL
jgi:hypothetical protein